MKRLLSVAITLFLVLSLGTAAYADDPTTEWHVTFTGKEEFEQDFPDYGGMASAIADTLSGMQPGDSATFYMELKNEHPETTDWYMTNEVRQSLEATREAASGGGYTYTLEYTGPDGETDTLFTSESIGGEEKPEEVQEMVNGETKLVNREGLREATSGLEDDFYLDTLKSGESGSIRLHVALEGETQGNAYQDTEAVLQMNFAVELNDTTPTTWRPVRTGDDANLLLWSGVMLGCGLAALMLGVYVLRRNRKDREESEDE